MQTDKPQTINPQSKNLKWTLKISDQKLFLEAYSQKTQITYKGQFKGFAGANLNHLVKLIEKGEYDLLTKSTTELQIYVAIFPIILNSEMSIQIQELKKKIASCEQKNQSLKSTINQLKTNEIQKMTLQNQQLKKKITSCEQKNQHLKSTIDELRANQVQKWEDVNLDNNQQQFNINYDYKITINSNCVVYPTRFDASNLYYKWGRGANQYETSYNSKKTSNTGNPVTKIQRRKI